MREYNWRSAQDARAGERIAILSRCGHIPLLGLCTKRESRALIERPYSRGPQAVGEVYDRPGFFVQSLCAGARGLKPATTCSSQEPSKVGEKARVSNSQAPYVCISSHYLNDQNWATKPKTPSKREEILKRIAFVSAVVLFISLIACADVDAQATAQISGTARDQSGAVLPGVEITVTQTDTRATRTAVTNETGSYVLPNLA